MEKELGAINTKFGDWLKTQREKLGLKQAEFSEKIGSQQGPVSRMEMGKSIPRYSVAARIAEGLGVHFHKVIDLIMESIDISPAPPAAKPAPKPKPDPKKVKVGKLFAKEKARAAALDQPVEGKPKVKRSHTKKVSAEAPVTPDPEPFIDSAPGGQAR